MTHKIKIIEVRNADKVGKSGKAYVQCSIKANNTQGIPVWINGFGNNTTKGWKQGQTVELDVYEDEYNGKKNLKFKSPPETNIIDVLQEINSKLDWLVGQGRDQNGMPGSTSQLPPKEEVKVEDIPF